MTQVTMNLSEESMENLQMVHRLTHASNRTTAMAHALSIARKILEEHQKGNSIHVVDGDYEQELLLSLN